MGQTETTLAKFVVDFPTDDIPSDVMHLAKRCLINYAGVSLYATLDPAIDILLDLLRAEGCLPAATVIGKGFRTSAQNAALANGFLGHLEDYDDTHTTVIHPARQSSPLRSPSANSGPRTEKSCWQRSSSALRSPVASVW